MDRRKKGRFVRRVFSSYVFIFLLLVILFFVGRGVWNVFAKYQAAEANNSETEERFETLQERKEALAREVERLDTEAGLETEIRERFNVAKHNEGVIYIVDSNDSQNSNSIQSEERTEEDEEKSVLQKIRSFFDGE